MEPQLRKLGLPTALKKGLYHCCIGDVCMCVLVVCVLVVCMCWWYVAKLHLICGHVGVVGIDMFGKGAQTIVMRIVLVHVGVVTLLESHKVCEEGDVLTPEQATVLVS